MLPAVLAADVGVFGTVLGAVPGVFGTVLLAPPVLPFLVVGTGCFDSPPPELFFVFSASGSGAGLGSSSLVGLPTSDFFFSGFV